MDVNVNVTSNGQRSLNCKDLRVMICRTCVEMKQIRDLEYRECKVLENLVTETAENYVEKGKLLSDAVKEVEFLREIWASLGNGDAAMSAPRFEDTEGAQQSPTLPSEGLEVKSERGEASEYLGVAPMKVKREQEDEDDDDDDDDESEIPTVNKKQKHDDDEEEEEEEEEDEDDDDEIDNKQVHDRKNDENRACYQLCRWLITNKGTVTKCKKVCTNTEIQSHIATEHLPTTERDLEGYVCSWEDCETTGSFKTKNELLLHVSQHAFDKKFRCTVHACGRMFASKADLDVHKSSHSCRRPFVMRRRCEDCGVRFVHKSSLLAHREFHLCGDAEADANRCPYKDCNKVFFNAKRLLKHKRSHVGEAYPCKVPGCRSVFSSKRNMNIHFTMVHKLDS